MHCCTSVQGWTHYGISLCHWVSKTARVDLLFSSCCEPARYWSLPHREQNSAMGVMGVPLGSSPRRRKERYNVAEEFILRRVCGQVHTSASRPLSVIRGVLIPTRQLRDLRNSRRRILPDAVLGIASMKWTSRGCL